MESIDTEETRQQVNAIIRNLTHNEIFVMDSVAEIDGRNPGLNDGEFLFRADSKGFFAAIDNSSVIGTITSIKYDDKIAFTGLHYVDELFINTGLKEKLLEVALNAAGERNIGINCREDEKNLYESYGFKPSFNIICFEGISEGINKNIPKDIISPLTLHFDDLYNYYKKFSPYERKVFLNYWVNQPVSLLLGKYDDDNDEYKGFGLFKPCRKGFRLSPLIADDASSAEEILTSLVSHYEAGTPYYLDMPEINNEGMRLAEKLNLKETGRLIRMYKGSEHKISLNKIYSFTSLEAG